jgi:hypothetical protein
MMSVMVRVGQLCAAATAVSAIQTLKMDVIFLNMVPP